MQAWRQDGMEDEIMVAFLELLLLVALLDYLSEMLAPTTSLMF